jgi:DNA invertase Pin-like site-specific DNA recombinase
LKVDIYARYSSDNQRDASIADQLRVCREFAARQGWNVVQEFSDHAISGATLLRSGFQALMRDALNARFDIVLAEALDRFSRDQEDTAGLFKRLTFAGVSIVTLAEGDITHLHVGLKGDLAGMLSAARDSKRSPDTGDLLVQIKLVAGACNQRYLQLWSGAA